MKISLMKFSSKNGELACLGHSKNQGVARGKLFCSKPSLELGKGLCKARMESKHTDDK